MRIQKTGKITALALSAMLSVSLFFGGCSGRKDTDLADFEAKTLSGENFTQDDLEDADVTVMNFWSLRCGPCIREMPDIAAYAGELPDNVRIITVCLDGEGKEEQVKKILDNAGFTGITLLAGISFTEDAGDFKTLCENIIYTPTTLIVDRDGNIVGNPIVGGQEDLEKTYTEAINKCLELLGEEEIAIGK